MSQSSRLIDLLTQWKIARANNQVVSPATLCRESPELLDDLVRLVKQHLNEEDWGKTHHATQHTDEPGVPAGVVEPEGYEILGVLGRGGMGVVYKAHQRSLNRIVALKMILRGAHAGEKEYSRFRGEAQAIAKLQHPNIVAVHEIGEHAGLPFFSLEYCPGGSFDRRLAGKPLTAKEAVALVRTLALAVQVAHDKGVIHRDLKPANVLLGETGTPKVADFGLARAVDDVGQTESGAVMGTPSYMPPEQASGKVRQLGPAVDTYALGAILYECLTGRPPFLAATPYDTIQQVMREEPVPPRQLNRQVPLDVETICLKCLEKDAERRYASCQELADDLGRWEEDKPIRARQVRAWEKVWRWARRNRAVAALTAAVVTILLASTVVAWALAAAARRSAEEARQNAAEANHNAALAKQNEQQAREESQRAQRTRDFLVSMFRASDATEFASYGLRAPNERGQSLTAKDLLERGAKMLEQNELKDQPLDRAFLQQTIGDVYRSMGQNQLADRYLEKAVEGYRELRGEEHPEYARALYHFGWNKFEYGDYDRAEALFRRALEIQEGKLGATDPATVDTRMHLAWVLMMYGDPKGTALFHQVVLERTKLYGAKKHQTMIAKMGLAVAFFNEHKVVEAFPLLLEVAGYGAGLEGGKNNVKAVALAQKGFTYSKVGWHGLARSAYEECIQIAKGQIGDTHPYLAIVHYELATVLLDQQKLTDAGHHLTECMRIVRATVGLEHPHAALAIGSYANLLLRLDRRSEALQIWQEADEANLKRFGPRSRSRFLFLSGRARVEAKAGSPQVAMQLTMEALRLLPQSAGRWWQMLGQLEALSGELFRNRQTSLALVERCVQETLRHCRGLQEKVPHREARVLHLYGQLLYQQGRCREARLAFLEALEKGQGQPFTQGVEGLNLRHRIGELWLAEGRFTEASEQYRENLEFARALPTPHLVAAQVSLAGPKVEQQLWAEALEPLRQAAEYKEDGSGPIRDRALYLLAIVEAAAGQHDKARERAVQLNDRTVTLLGARALLITWPGDADGVRAALCAAWQARESLLTVALGVDTMTLALLRVGHPNEAERLLQDHPPARGREAFWTLYRAWVAHLRRQPDQARTLYAEVQAYLRAVEPGTASVELRAASRWSDRLELQLLAAQVGAEIDKPSK